MAPSPEEQMTPKKRSQQNDSLKVKKTKPNQQVDQHSKKESKNTQTDNPVSPTLSDKTVEQATKEKSKAIKETNTGQEVTTEDKKSPFKKTKQETTAHLIGNSPEYNRDSSKSKLSEIIPIIIGIGLPIVAYLLLRYLKGKQNNFSDKLNAEEINTQFAIDKLPSESAPEASWTELYIHGSVTIENIHQISGIQLGELSLEQSVKLIESTFSWAIMDHALFPNSNTALEFDPEAERILVISLSFKVLSSKSEKLKGSKSKTTLTDRLENAKDFKLVAIHDCTNENINKIVDK